ncbi:hypothetical protein [Duncaniella muris]|uniref:hypothetical protein n=1 Tax=Duncaniella muris TaxID=2094150 RepID=UPI003F662C01
MAIVNRQLQKKGASSKDASRFIVDALFTTITNANFDNDMLDGYITKPRPEKQLEGESKSAAWSLLSCLRCRIHIPKRNNGVHEVIEHSGTLEEEITPVCSMTRTRI